MQTNNFQQKLRREILGYSVVLIGFITILLSVGLIIFNQVSINIQMTESESTVSNLMATTLDNYEAELIKQRKELYLNFMKADAHERNIYSSFYTMNSQQTVKGDLILFDPNMAVQFSSGSYDFDGNAFKHYVSLIVADLMPAEPVVQRVYRDRNKEYNLLLVTTISEGKGYAVYVISGREIRNQLSQLPNQFIIYDRFDNVLASSSSQFIQGPLDKIDSDKIDGKFHYGTDLFFSQKRKLSDDLMLAVFQKGLVYTALLRISVTVVLALMLLLIAFAFWFSKKISIRNAKSVELLSNEMAQLVEEMNYSINLETGDEFELISTKINEMLDELSGAHQKNIDLLKENILAERKMLEAQFNPHFLYNTLEVIRASIAFDPALSNQLILRLTKILRYSIEEKMEEVTLRTDLRYLEEYLMINRIRFQDFSYQLDIEEAALDLPIPKLFLLPIIENSLKYGFKHRHDLTINLSIKKSGAGTYLIQVTDNGQALTKSRAFEINYNLQNNIPMGNHHGLMNSKRRIQLMYTNAQFDLHVTGDETIVEVRIGEWPNV